MITESDVEAATLEWFEGLGYNSLHWELRIETPNPISRSQAQSGNAV